MHHGKTFEMLRLFTLIFQYDIHKNALKVNIIEIIILTRDSRRMSYELIKQ